MFTHLLFRTIQRMELKCDVICQTESSDWFRSSNVTSLITWESSDWFCLSVVPANKLAAWVKLPLQSRNNCTFNYKINFQSLHYFSSYRRTFDVVSLCTNSRQTYIKHSFVRVYFNKEQSHGETNSSVLRLTAMIICNIRCFTRIQFIVS